MWYDLNVPRLVRMRNTVFYFKLPGCELRLITKVGKGSCGMNQVSS